MAVIPGEVVRRMTPPPLAGPPTGPAASLANGANNLRDVTSQPGAGAYGGGYTLNPDPGLIQGYVNAQPGVQAAQANLVFGGGQSSDQARQALQQILIAYGSPDLARSFGAAVDPQTASLAQAATHPLQGAYGNSTLAQLQYAADTAKQNAMAHMLSSGQYRSGQLPFELQQESMYNAGKASDALTSVQNQIYGINQQNLSTQLGLQSDYAKALQSGYQNVLGHQSLYPMPGPTAQGVGAAPTGAAATPYGAGQSPITHAIQGRNVAPAASPPAQTALAAAPHGGAF